MELKRKNLLITGPTAGIRQGSPALADAELLVLHLANLHEKELT